MCLTAQDLLDFRINGCLVSETICIPFDEIQKVVDEAIERVQYITSTLFCSSDGCMQFNGSGTSRLYFKPTTITPLISLTTATILCCNSTELVTDTIENRGDWLDLTCGGCFPCGTNNIQVCGTWGAYATLPLTVERVMLSLAAEIIQPGITGLQTDKNAIDSIVWTDLSINYRTTEVDFAGMSTGVPYLDQLLQPFIPTIAQIDFFTIGESDECVKKCCGFPTKNKNVKCDCSDSNGCCGQSTCS